MVTTLLWICSLLTLVVWLLQELGGRPMVQRRLNELVDQGQKLPVDDLQANSFPTWMDLTLKLLLALWLIWVAAVLLLKDGDFALVLVVLTLLSGLIAGIDRFVFEGARKAYVGGQRLASFLSQYTEAQRQHFKTAFAGELVVAEYARSFFPVLLVVLVLRSFLFEPFQIPSASMVPSLLIGDYILVNKFNYGLRLPVLQTKLVDINEPQRGDVVVFFPPNDKRYFIKRLVGLPGDQVSYRDKQLFINGEPVDTRLVAELPPQQPVIQVLEEQLGEARHLIHNDNRAFGGRLGDFSVTVKPGHYFMMGDNRDNSSDSRVWGQVPERNIVGQAVAIWMHWPSLGGLPDFSRVGGIE